MKSSRYLFTYFHVGWKMVDHIEWSWIKDFLWQMFLGHHPHRNPYRIPICSRNVHHEILEVDEGHSILGHDNIQFLFKRVSMLHHLYNACHSTFKYMLLYTWHTIVVRSSKCLTWSNIIYDVSMSPLTCIHFTNSTSLPRRSTNILITKCCFLIALGTCYHRQPWMHSGL